MSPTTNVWITNSTKSCMANTTVTTPSQEERTPCAKLEKTHRLRSVTYIGNSALSLQNLIKIRSTLSQPSLYLYGGTTERDKYASIEIPKRPIDQCQACLNSSTPNLSVYDPLFRRRRSQ